MILRTADLELSLEAELCGLGIIAGFIGTGSRRPQKVRKSLATVTAPDRIASPPLATSCGKACRRRHRLVTCRSGKRTHEQLRLRDEVRDRAVYSLPLAAKIPTKLACVLGIAKQLGIPRLPGLVEQHLVRTGADLDRSAATTKGAVRQRPAPGCSYDDPRRADPGLKLALIDSDPSGGTHHNCIVIARRYRRQLGKILLLICAAAAACSGQQAPWSDTRNAHVHQRRRKRPFAFNERNSGSRRNTAAQCSVAAAVGKGDGATIDRRIATHSSNNDSAEGSGVSRPDCGNIDHGFGERIDSVCVQTVLRSRASCPLSRVIPDRPSCSQRRNLGGRLIQPLRAASSHRTPTHRQHETRSALRSFRESHRITGDTHAG